MRAVGQTVDDRDGRVGRELLDIGLRKRPDHDCVEIAREDDGRVLDRLTAPQLEIARGEVEACAAELIDPDLERNPRSSRRLLEDHPERSAGEEVVLLARLLSTLEVVGQVEHLEQLVAAPVRDPGEGAPFQAVGDGDHPARSYGRTLVPAVPASASAQRIEARDQRLAGEAERGFDLRAHRAFRQLPAATPPHHCERARGSLPDPRLRSCDRPPAPR